MVKILIGTTGFSYDEWDKPNIFYPENTEDKLAYYAKQFDMITISGTYDAGHPPTKLYRNWIESVSENPNFSFLVLAPKIFTSKLSILRCKKEWDKFWNGFCPNSDGDNTYGGCKILHESGVLGAIILQFDGKYEYSKKRLSKILEITKVIPKDVYLTFDFLHCSWKDSIDEIFPIFKEKKWALTTSFVENGLVNFGWAGNLTSTRTHNAFTHKNAVLLTSDFMHISLNGTYGPGIGSYDFDGFLEKLAKRLMSAKVDKIYCSFDASAPGSTFCYPLPALVISGFNLCPKMAELPLGTVEDRPCCLHDALKFRKLIKLRRTQYARDSEGYIALNFC